MIVVSNNLELVMQMCTNLGHYYLFKQYWTLDLIHATNAQHNNIDYLCIDNVPHLKTLENVEALCWW